jgi:hypothetical protein
MSETYYIACWEATGEIVEARSKADVDGLRPYSAADVRIPNLAICPVDITAEQLEEIGAGALKVDSETIPERVNPDEQIREAGAVLEEVG